MAKLLSERQMPAGVQMMDFGSGGLDLAYAGLRVLVPARLPPNDGGIAYGQAAVACALTAGSRDRPRPGG